MAYATVQELTDFLAPAAAPADAARLLDRASRDVDEAIITAVYDTDANGDPTDPDVLNALKAATLEQAAYRIAAGDGGAGQWGQVTLGPANLTRRTDRIPPSEVTVGALGADAHKVLKLAGLLGNEPWTW